ncbi:MAG: hypothetical protein MI725_02450 [Pirellulales bacterium]|nr:hypothetical protein [Pirellulales bacterium]
MEIHGHIQNGKVVFDDAIPLPDGVKVTVLVEEKQSSAKQTMSPDEQARYVAALRQIDTVANENPGDILSGADHDQVLYGNR